MNKMFLGENPIHIEVKDKSDIAQLVLMPGDPLRAKYIAENFLDDVKCVTSVRNMLGFTGFYKGKKVLVTGHTGFKGSWLCRLLLKLGAEVTGYALEPPTQPDLFRLLDVFRHLLRRRALHRPTVQFLQHRPRSHAPAMGSLLRIVVD